MPHVFSRQSRSGNAIAGSGCDKSEENASIRWQGTSAVTSGLCGCHPIYETLRRQEMTNNLYGYGSIEMTIMDGSSQQKKS
ncbi:hypothetical protein H9L39_17074 [Fusarium oxysporum f. sp. albedinis]|nr:hypothetical protein H9L39_17074 [Fusarium oxysporum f. sp. albedinis]